MASKKQSLVGARLEGSLWASVGTLSLDMSMFIEAIEIETKIVDLDKLKDAFEKHYRVRPESDEIEMKGIIRYADGRISLETFDLLPQKRKVGTKKNLRSKTKAKRRKGK